MVILFRYMTIKALSVFALFTFCINTSNAQNVASAEEKNVIWLETNQYDVPVSSNYSLALRDFNGTALPAISGQFETKDRAVLEFSDFKYEALVGYPRYKANELIKLTANVQTKTYHTLEGKNIITAYYLCPFKYENNNYYRLVSYKVKVLPGMPFYLGQDNDFSNSKRAAASSVLNSGTWFKFSVTADGMYKIPASFFTSQNIALNTVNPKTIKVYSHQGGMLSEINSAFRYDDLPEMSIQVVGESDGVLNPEDYVVFYAQSPHKWKYSNTAKRFVHEMNIYSDKTYFFLTFGGDNGKRMATKSDGNNLTADASYNWFENLDYHEEEIENICHEGRIVLGEKFDQKLVYNFTHNISNITSNNMMQLFVEAGAVATVNSSMLVKMNGVNADVLNFSSLQDADRCFEIDQGSGEIVPTSNLNISFSYAQPNSSSKAWLNYYELICSRELKYSESFMPFRNSKTAQNSVAEFRLNNLPNNYYILDVSNPVSPSIQQTFTGGGEWVFRYSPNGLIREFVLVDGNTNTPTFEGAVANQNLHATGVVQFIILTHPDFKEAATKLANWHTTRDNLDVKVVTPQEIYNEFSSGSQDISAIRDYFKHVYYANTNPVNQLRYVMFMGDASYDYKDKVPNNTNFVPIFESEDKWAYPNYFAGYYCSDDFFGYLDSTDGKWYDEQMLEIGVSRLPVASSTEAMSMVDKIINYKDKVSLGEWRNFVSFCADDVDDLWEREFVTDFESLYKLIDTSYKNVNVRKVYIDAFKQQNLGGSQRYPDAQLAIKKEFEQGTLIFNYIGHGGEEYLATEKVLDIPLINSMSNINTLPVFFTATCEFSRYDDAKHKSAGEHVITHPNGGSIAMFTTTRVVNSADNFALTNFFWNSCAYSKVANKWLTLGEMYKRLKNWYGASPNDRRFTLFADPALTINYPDYVIKIDSLNNAALSGKDTLKALSKVTIAGHLEDINGAPLNNFNGIIYPIVYDKPSQFKTLNNDNVVGGELDFQLYSSILYKGQSSVNSGKYRFTFVVPKDINYVYGYGKISMYSDNQLIDASGSDKGLIIGGASSNAATDVVGPQIELFVDDYNFVSGGLTDNSPLLLARVFDENGISTSGIGIGRDIVAIIDKGTPNEKRYVLNAFYKAKLNSYTTGDISYLLDGVSEGKHTYTLKVWDVYNNSNEATIDFVVKNNAELQLDHVLNYPNPFSTNTAFHFDHNHAGENLKVVVTILTVSGRVIKSIEQNITNAPGHVQEIAWNGKDDYEDKLSKGVYIYKLSVTTEDGKKAEKIEKLVILN